MAGQIETLGLEEGLYEEFSSHRGRRTWCGPAPTGYFHERAFPVRSCLKEEGCTTCTAYELLVSPFEFEGREIEQEAISKALEIARRNLSLRAFIKALKESDSPLSEILREDGSIGLEGQPFKRWM